jgi:hemolysin D
MQRKPPRLLARMVTLSLCLMAVTAAAYAYLAQMDVVVSSQGSVMTPGRSKVVQPLEAGVVKAIRVRDGQKVRTGDVLVELDPTSSQADSERLAREFAEARAEVQRLQALLEDQAFVEVDEDIADEILDNQQAILENRRAELRSRLSALDADIAKRQADRDAVSTNLQQLRLSLVLVQKRHAMRQELAQAEFRSQVTTEMVEATKRRDAAEKELTKAQQRASLQVLKAPIDGIVQQLAVFTDGGVVTQAQVLMAIVPENEGLEVEAKVLNRDIGHVHVGQRVINKIETFDFTRYGYIEGEVQWVGTDAVVDERLGPVYPVRIKLAGGQTPNVVHGLKGQITAGMSVTSDIRIGERRMLEYFLAPLLRYKEESLRER